MDATPTRRRRTAVAAAVAALLALGAAGCGGDDDGDDGGEPVETAPVEAGVRSPRPSAAAAGAAAAVAAAGEAGMSDDAATLLDDYALTEDDCTELDAPEAVAAVSCDLDGITYDLTRMGGDEQLRAGFTAVVEDNEATPSWWYYESDPDARMGQVFSYAGGRRSHVHWTNEEELVIGHASLVGGDSLSQLEEWWGSDGSTVESGTA